MIRDSDESDAMRDDELFDSLLVAYDDALASGTAPPDVGATQLPTALARDLESAESLLELLEQVRRTRDSLAPHSSAAVDALGEASGDSRASGAGNPQEERRIGRFRIIRELGRGGYGVVFLAEDPRLPRQVALKVARPEVSATQELSRRFLREAQAAGSLAHPNLVTVYEVGQDGPIQFIASAYCSGLTLAGWLRSRTDAVPVRDAVELVAALADGVEHAHRLGVLHRDIKPSNVLLEPQSASGLCDDVAAHAARFTPKLTDFGLARLADGDGTTTRTGAMLGTASYMAPEQATGRLNIIGPPTDVYGLGTILYELLTGQRAFQGASDVDTIRRAVTDEPIRPRRLRENIPRDLEAICLKCLEKLPQDRYKSAALLAQDLRRFLAGEPTLARPAGPMRRTWKWARRRPATASLLTAIALLLTAIVLGGSWYSARLATQHAVLLERQYVHDIRAAFEARENGDFDRAAALLARYGDGTQGAALRNFEWYYLRGALDDDNLTIPSRHGEAYTVVFSPDGSLLLSGGEDGVIRAWDPHSGSLRFELRGHTSCVNQLAFSPDGKTLASASCDHTVRLWDWADRREIGTLGEHPDEVMCLAYANQHPWVATGSHGSMVRVWNVETGALVVELAVPSAGPTIDAVTFRRDDEVLAATNGVQNTLVWDTDSWTQIGGYPLRAITLGFVGPQQQLAYGTKSGEVAWFNIGSGFSVSLLGHVPMDAYSLVPMHRGNIFFVGCEDGSIHAFDRHHKLAGTRLGGTRRVQSLAVSRDDRLLASASFDGTLRVWDLEHRSLHQLELVQPEELAISPNGARAVALYTDGRGIRSWSLRSAAIAAEADGLHQCRFSPQGKYVVSVTGLDWKLRLLHATSLKPASSLPRELRPLSVSISADDRVIAVLEESGRASVFDIASGDKLLEYDLRRADGGKDVSLSLSRDGSLLTWIDKGRISSFAVDVKSGRHVPLPDDLSFLHVTSVYFGGEGFSPDGRWVVRGRPGQAFDVCDVYTGKPVHKLPHTGGFSGRIAWSPDGTRLAIATRDLAVVLYDPRTGDPLGKLDACLEPIISNLVFSADGRTLMAFTGGIEGSPGRWQVWRAERD